MFVLSFWNTERSFSRILYKNIRQWFRNCIIGTYKNNLRTKALFEKTKGFFNFFSLFEFFSCSSFLDFEQKILSSRVKIFGYPVQTAFYLSICVLLGKPFFLSLFFASFSDSEQNQLGLLFHFFRWGNQNCILLVLPYSLTVEENRFLLKEKVCFFSVMDIEVNKLGLVSEKKLGRVVKTAFFVPKGGSLGENLIEKVGWINFFFEPWARCFQFFVE